jgi:hypothetical protein
MLKYSEVFQIKCAESDFIHAFHLKSTYDLVTEIHHFHPASTR